MPIPEPSQKALQASLRRRALLLAQFIDIGTAKAVCAEQVALIVQTAIRLLGREVIDQALETKLADLDAMEKGLCVSCRVRPSMENDIFCKSCEEKAKEDEQYVQLLILDEDSSAKH